VDDALVIQLRDEELFELNNGWCARAHAHTPQVALAPPPR
jgi:hypothetical protein